MGSNGGRGFSAVIAFILTAPFILLSAVVFIVLGPILWIPLIVRALFLYAIMLLLHAIVGKTVEGSTLALEESIKWYFVCIPKILSHLGDYFVDDEDDKSSDGGVDQLNPLSSRFWEGLLSALFEFIKRSLWAALFWIGVLFIFAHLGWPPAVEFVGNFADPFKNAPTTYQPPAAPTVVAPPVLHPVVKPAPHVRVEPQSEAPPPPVVTPPQPEPTPAPDDAPTVVPPPPQSSAAQPDQQLQPGITPPLSFGRPHTCGDYYPPISVRLGEQGTTTLAFMITDTGRVRYVVVIRSSGSNELDRAAAVCVLTWQYQPARKNGVPIAVNWRAEVKWVLN